MPDNLADDFDFLLNGVIDSFGILEMISAIEKEFRIQSDLADLDAEQITILGPLSRYVAERGCFRPESFPNSGSEGLSHSFRGACAANPKSK